MLYSRSKPAITVPCYPPSAIVAVTQAVVNQGFANKKKEKETAPEMISDSSIHGEKQKTLPSQVYSVPRNSTILVYIREGEVSTLHRDFTNSDTAIR